MNIEKEMQTYIHLSKYSRWIEKENRRETWDETIDRFRNYWLDRYDDKSDKRISEKIMEMTDYIRKFKVMPSMRVLMTAGKALQRDEAAGYNCSAAAVTHPRVFDECFYLLMCGCGFGFSVERQYINKLPTIDEEMYESDSVVVVRDSKIGWATALKELISMLYNGQIPKWDLSKVRPAGTRLKTFGGRASGPEPLDRLFEFTVRLFKKAKGRKLRSIECHDLICKIAETVIVGSVRRSATISLSNLTDDRMRRAKTGQWWIVEPQRALANNSVAYTEKPDIDAFSKEWRTLYKSKSGERGIINKEALRKKAEACGREYDGDYIINPCGEAILRDTGGFCNLTEIIAKEKDDLKTLVDKARMATIIGVFQSTLTNFRYLRKVWRNNAEEDRLLGISITGIMDHPILSGMEDKKKNNSDYTILDEWLTEIKAVCRRTADEMASILGINQPTQLTLVKPSGTVSQLCNTASGIHPRYSEYYIRRVRNDKKDPLSHLMIDEGIPYVEDGEKFIFSFFIKSPKSSVCGSDITAMEQLEIWKVYRNTFCDGNPSQTIYYTDDEYFAIADWIWKNWDDVGGLSFFPKDDHIYNNAPYETINKELYDEFVDLFPKEIQWDRLPEFETVDGTQRETELACAGGACEI
jgi:ribonucleoside-diphosphate reductase alpha chain